MRFNLGPNNLLPRMRHLAATETTGAWIRRCHRQTRTRLISADFPFGDHALIDGNKRLALAAVIAFFGLNGRRLTLTNDEAYDLVMSVAAGHLDDVDAIAAVL